MYTIGEMAKKLNMTPSTLRYYEQEGLMPFVERSEGGIRMFKDSDMEWLTVIGCLKKTGMSLKDIKAFIDWCVEGDTTIDQRLELIDRRREAVLEQIEQLQETLSILEYKHWYYEAAREAGTCKIHETMKEEEIPEQFRENRKKLLQVN